MFQIECNISIWNLCESLLLYIYIYIYLVPLLPPFTSCGNERVQQKGPDIAEQRLCNQRPGAAGFSSEHRLLVVPGGGRHHASEPKRGHQDVAALGPLEGLLPRRWALSLAGMLWSTLPWWEVTTCGKLRVVKVAYIRTAFLLNTTCKVRGLC